MIAIGDAIEAVTGRRCETQPTGQLLTVDFISGSRQRAASQRADIEALERVLQTAFITGQHFNVGQTPVRKSHRLGALQMGITRHHRILIVASGFHQRALQLAGRGQQLGDGLFAPQLEIGGDLVITATSGMQFFAQLADFIDQFSFDPAMNIFGIAFKDLLRVGAYLFQQDVQRLFQLQLLIGGQYAYGYQRFGPGDGSHDILFRQTIVKA